MFPLETFHFKQLVSYAVMILVMIVPGISFSMAVPAGGRVAACRYGPCNNENADLDNAQRYQTDIFDIILKANTESTTSETPVQAEASAEGLYQGDILMTKEQRLALKASGTDILTLPDRVIASRAVNGNDRARWPADGSGRVQVPYVIEHPSVPDRSIIHRAMSHWTDKVPCIEFVTRTAQPNYLSFFSGQGCFSWVGRKGGKQRISIGQGCAVMGVIAHEIGHALGFWHEQSRPDRDKYVRILWNNIKPDHLDDFKMIDNADTNDLGVDYDLASLMHYGPKAFSKSPLLLNTIEKLDGSINFGQRNGLSDKDIEQARLLYCNGSSVCRHKDRNTSCPWWADAGFCRSSSTYYNFMNTYCKRSCYCGYVCEDKIANCPSEPAGTESLCTKKQYKKFMSLFCKKSCHLCAV